MRSNPWGPGVPLGLGNSAASTLQDLAHRRWYTDRRIFAKRLPCVLDAADPAIQTRKALVSGSLLFPENTDVAREDFIPRDNC